MNFLSMSLFSLMSGHLRPRKIALRLGLRFGLELGLRLGLRGNFPRGQLSRNRFLYIEVPQEGMVSRGPKVGPVKECLNQQIVLKKHFLLKTCVYFTIIFASL